MKYSFRTKCTDVFERKLRKHVGGSGKDASFIIESAGWYIQLGGEITLYVGEDKPELKIGTDVKLTLQARSPE